MTSDLIFRTIHGSRLYGLDHTGSDWDHFEVRKTRAAKAHHTVKVDDRGNTYDTVVMGIQHFLDMALSGSHQSVEALFSGRKMYGPEWETFGPLLNGLVITGPTVFDKYERTIKSFSYGDFKRRRHAVRLSYNLYDLRSEGYFNPHLTPTQITWANHLANTHEGDDLHAILRNGGTA